MAKLTKKDVARVETSLKEAFADYSKNPSNRNLKRVCFLEATLRRYKKAI